MTEAAEILLVDDDVLIQLMVEDVVTQLGHRFTCAGDGASAREALTAGHFDLVILDRRLPDTDGLLLAQAIQAEAKSPFIVLSSLGSPDDQVLGLGLGALDYICKPVEPAVLRARIERHVAVRRAPSDEAIVAVGSRLRLNVLTRRLSVAGRTEVLSPAETRLLVCLIRALGQPLDRAGMSMAICGREWVYGDRTVDVLVSRLRRRLRGSKCGIVTVHGIGYILTEDEPAD
ncbi:response regulator transcription factor [Tropicimonas sp. IMCC34043]|uniref:response regulator transcription factor n=1 Tax=Tropicimonas sp. IMCC34043 TaxID=2248760 RepID=UPI000E249859|nr:response regulator transcription factor [Tropicimonas sp. IMCC34043]